jgi:hypothetical protein
LSDEDESNEDESNEDEFDEWSNYQKLYNFW